MHHARAAIKQRTGRAAAALVAGTLGLFGITWWLTPADNALIFGVPLAGPALAYGRVKGAEDLLAALLIGSCLWRGDARRSAQALWLGLIVPMGDALALASVGLTHAGVLAIHGVFAVVMVASAFLLQPPTGDPP